MNAYAYFTFDRINVGLASHHDLRRLAAVTGYRDPAATIRATGEKVHVYRDLYTGEIIKLAD